MTTPYCRRGDFPAPLRSYFFSRMVMRELLVRHASRVAGTQHSRVSLRTRLLRCCTQETKMRLADFIDANMPAILAEWDLFASSLLPAAGELGSAALRDHAEQMLHAMAEDLRMPQTRREQSVKSKGLAPVLQGAADTAAQTHA